MQRINRISLRVGRSGTQRDIFFRALAKDADVMTENTIHHEAYEAVQLTLMTMCQFTDKKILLRLTNEKDEDLEVFEIEGS